MKTWEDFYPDVAPEVPGCPDPTMDTALRRSAQRFVAETAVWRQWLDDVTTNGTLEQDLELEPNTELVQVLRATLDDNEIKVYAPAQLPANWRTASAGLDVGICTMDGKSVQLVPTQSAGLALAIEATLQPSNRATGVPDVIFDRYVLAIAMGAKAQLMAHLTQPYGNAKLSGAYAQMFQDEIDRVGSDQWHGMSSAALRVRATFL